MVYIPGKEHVGPDITSRYPGGQGNQEDLLKHNNGCHATSLQMNYCLMNAALIGDTVDAMALICDPDKEAKKEESEELEISMKMATVILLKSFKHCAGKASVKPTYMTRKHRRLCKWSKADFRRKGTNVPSI